MFGAQSVAVVGASPRPTSAGNRALTQLIQGGFEGRVHLVNPNYERVLGYRCHSTLADVDDVVDLALLMVPNHLLQDQLEIAAGLGVRAAVIFASGHDEGREDDFALTERIAEQARAAGIAVCGGNCMGFVDVERRLRALAYPEGPLEAGTIAWLSHSGSAFTALLHNDRSLRFNLAVSAGQELTTTIADYLLYALDRASTRTVAMFVETVRDPARFVDALRVAEHRDIPIVALKVGNVGMARTMVAAHSGALAGEEAAFDALFDAFGVMRVRTLNEMADTLELLQAGRRAAPGGLAAIHDSGGERAHLVDVAETVGIDFARISSRTERALGEVLEPGLAATNPLDAWGTGNDADRIFFECMSHLLADGDTGALAFVADFKHEEPEDSYVSVALKTFASTEKPFAVLSNLSSAIDPEAAAEVRASGVPVLEDTATGLLAFAHLFELRARRDLPALESPQTDPVVATIWRERLVSPQPWGEAEGLSLLSDYGIAVAPGIEAASEGEVVAAAEELGGPVALKSALPGVSHKTESRGVALGLGDVEGTVRAYQDMASRLGERVLVQRMAEPGVELALGIVRDPQFGPLVAVAAGGVLVEIMEDRRLALPPLDETRTRRLLDRLRVRKLLNGVRGSPPSDVDAVVQAIVRVSWLAADLGDRLDALDVNPVIAGPTGCVAVDALVVPRAGVGAG
jgi:acyl-CoA synthetase (NDP forming)